MHGVSMRYLHSCSQSLEITKSFNLYFKMLCFRQLPADEFKCTVTDCSVTDRFESRAELRGHMVTHMQCEFCQKTFRHRRYFKEHIKQDIECKKIKRTLKKMVQFKAFKLAESFREDEYDSSSDSGMGTSSNASLCSEPEPCIKMTFGKSIGQQYEVVMASENVPKKRTYEIKEPNVKRRKLDCDNIVDPVDPMVTIKTELLKDLDFFNVKQEEMEPVNIDDLLEDLEEDIKPPIMITTPVNAKPGIRLIIDKKDMKVAMTSEMSSVTHPSSRSNLDPEIDVKPALADLEKQIKAGIKMVIGKEKTKDGYSVLLESELMDTEASSEHKHKCENQGCSKLGHHICVYPKYRQMGGLVKTKGVVNLKHSFYKKRSRFTVFNKSFYSSFGCIFYFKAHNGHVEVRTRSTSKERHRFKLTFYQTGFETNTFCTLGGNKYKSSVALPTHKFKGDFLKYKIVIYAVP